MSGSILPASSVDRRLIRAAAKYASPQEMSEAVLGQLTPEQCLNRVLEIIDSKTVYDEVRERRLLLMQMAEWVDWIKEQRDNPKSWAVIARSLKVLSDQIERSNINVSDMSTKLAAEHARFFAEGFMLGFSKVLEVLRERDMIEVEEEDIAELAELGVGASQEYLERVTARSADGD